MSAPRHPKYVDRVHPVGFSATGWGWRHASRARWALHDLDISIEPGERVLLLGASGSGKSTLLQAMAGVLGAEDEGESTGQLRVDGQHASRARGRIGLLLQDPDSQVILEKVGRDVAFGCENLGIPREEIWSRVHSALADVGLRLPLDHSTAQLSGGQKQRLALAGILAMHPGALLLDEPTANLDPDGVVEVRDAVHRVLDATDATFVVVEHRVDVWLPVINRVIVLSSDGTVTADGRPDDVLVARGAELAATGVWVPGWTPAFPVRRAATGELLLASDELTVGRRARGRRESTFERSCPATSVREGTTTVLTGANGSGKTTFGLTLAGLLPPIAGNVVASAKLRGSAGEHPIEWKSRELLTRIGTVFQEPEHQFLRAKVREELAVGPRALRLGERDIAERVDELMERLRLSALAEANPFTLSGGEKRRLSVATVLASRPRVLVLDEPTFGQDSRTWEELVALLAEHAREENSIVAMTHDALFVDAVADVRVEL